VLILEENLLVASLHCSPVLAAESLPIVAKGRTAEAGTSTVHRAIAFLDADMNSAATEAKEGPSRL